MTALTSIAFYLGVIAYSAATTLFFLELATGGIIYIPLVVAICAAPLIALQYLVWRYVFAPLARDK